jgi:hypothetical protein
MSTYTQEPDADLTAWIAEIDEQSALDVALAKAMADYRAQAVADNDEEVEILPGEDTICVVCEHPLPAGATGYRDKRDEDRRVRCCDCKAFEDKAAGRTVR